MKRVKIQAFTLVELITVVIAIGVLSAIVFPKYVKYREKTIDKQGQVILKTIRAAERNYMMINGTYYPPNSYSVFLISDINDKLGLELVNDGVWDQITITGVFEGFYARLVRNKGGYNRWWEIDEDLENATCNYQSGVNNWCPN